MQEFSLEALKQRKEAAKKAAKKAAEHAINQGTEAAKNKLEQVQSNQTFQKITQGVQRVANDTSDFLTPLLERVLEIPEIKELAELKQKFTKVITILREKEAFNQLFDDEINAPDNNEIRKTQLLALRNILAQNINVFTYNDYRNNRFFNYEYILLILRNRLAVLRDIQGSIQGSEGKLVRLLEALKMDNTLKEYILGTTETKPKPPLLKLADSFFGDLTVILINFTESKETNGEPGGLQTIIHLFEQLKNNDNDEKIKTQIQKSVIGLNEKDRSRVMEFLKKIEEQNSTNNNNKSGGTRRNKTNQKKRKSSKRKIHK